MNLQEYLDRHTLRGACRCGKCCDSGPEPEKNQPAGHTADMIFFKVSAVDDPSAEELRRLIGETKGEFTQVNLLDGKEHSYIEIGAWIGDQGAALRLMGLGALLGLWKLLTPRTVLGVSLPDDLVMRMATQGFVGIQAAAAAGVTQ